MTTPDITLAVAKQHLRVDHTDDDADITRKLDQANAIVWDYIKHTPDDEAEGAWAPDALQLLIIEAATLMVLSKLYDDRNIGEEDNQNVALGYLTPQVTATLHRLRDPALA
jgi:Phage gp6-like head-tail connector protein